MIKSGDQLVAVGEVDIRDMKPAAVGNMLSGEEVSRTRSMSVRMDLHFHTAPQACLHSRHILTGNTGKGRIPASPGCWGTGVPCIPVYVYMPSVKPPIAACASLRACVLFTVTGKLAPMCTMRTRTVVRV